MFADLIFIATAHPFVTGLLVGAVGIGAPVGVIGWCLGHDACARSIWAHVWAQMEAEDQVHSDVPNVPGRAA
jgi:hypothetical protein